MHGWLVGWLVACPAQLSLVQRLPLYDQIQNGLALIVASTFMAVSGGLRDGTIGVVTEGGVANRRWLVQHHKIATPR